MRKKYIVQDNKYLKPYERERVKVIERLLPTIIGDRPALDLGCGSGYFSRMLIDRGWKVTAVDAEEENIAEALRFAVKGIVGRLPEALDELRGERFELVLMLELIEHLERRQGEALLATLGGLVADGGHLLVSTPNRCSLPGLRHYYWGELIKGAGKWEAWDDTHQYVYGSWEFLRLLRSLGWKILQVAGYWYAGDFPLGIRVRMPFLSAGSFPLNRFGFDLIVLCRKEPA